MNARKIASGQDGTVVGIVDLPTKLGGPGHKNRQLTLAVQFTPYVPVNTDLIGIKMGSRPIIDSLVKRGAIDQT